MGHILQASAKLHFYISLLLHPLASHKQGMLFKPLWQPTLSASLQGPKTTPAPLTMCDVSDVTSVFFVITDSCFALFGALLLSIFRPPPFYVSTCNASGCCPRTVFTACKKDSLTKYTPICIFLFLIIFILLCSTIILKIHLLLKTNISCDHKMTM